RTLAGSLGPDGVVPGWVLAAAFGSVEDGLPGLLGEFEEEPSPPENMTAATTMATTATTARPPPRISIMLPPPFFFLEGRSSSSSPRRRGPALLGPLAPALPLSPAFFLSGLASSSSPSGSSTTNRYLHFGQSILRPISPGSRIGTIASQLGHCCLKLVPVAMNRSPATRCARPPGRTGCERTRVSPSS